MSSSDEIKSIALENGFKLRAQPDDSIDLNPYVYHFAMAMYRRGRAERMAEIRPLVADLRTNAEIGQHFLRNEPWLNEAQADAKAVERLRELVRESEK